MKDAAAQRFNLSRWALQNQPLVRFLMAILLLGGLLSFFQLGQDEDPPFTFRAMIVRAYWPGASAELMAEQVTDKIELALQSVPYADRIRSYTKPGESLTIFQLSDDSPKAAVESSFYQVRKRVQDIQMSLPDGVIGPFFNDDFGDTYGVIYAFRADGFNEGELKVYVDQVRQQLLRVPDVAKVELFGVQEEKVFLEVDHARLSQTGLSIQHIAEQLNSQLAIENSGLIHLDRERLWLRVSGAPMGVADLEALPLRVQGEAGQGGTIRLGELFKVSRGVEDPPLTKVHFGDAAGASEVIALGVSMRKGGDIIRLGQALDDSVARINVQLPVGIEIIKAADQPQAVSDSVREFLKVLAEAVSVVLAVSFLFLGVHRHPLRVDMRPGLVVALTIPLVLAATFLCMYVLNINLHKVSLGALIIALGLLVDDAIIAVEMMIRKMEEGLPRLEAAVFAYRSTAFPMLTGTLITVAGFLPIGLAKSMAGEYTFSIFAVTAIALVLSWFAAVIFTPFLGYHLLKTRTREEAHGDVFQTPFYRRFRRWVDYCLRYRWWVISFTLVLLGVGVLSFKWIEQQFFPDSNRVELMADLWLAEGASFQATEQEARRLEQWLGGQQEVQSYLAYLGIGSPRFYLPLDQQMNQTNLAQFVITPRSLEDRDRLRPRLEAFLQSEFPDVRARVKLLSSGPPVPYAVQFRVQGPELEEVKRIAGDVRAVMADNPYLQGINDNWNEPVKAVHLEIDQARARALGVSSASLQQTAAFMTEGVTIARLREDNKLIPVIVRQPASERGSLTRLAQASVPTASGQWVPLLQVAAPSLRWEPGVIWRENRDYAMTVQADVIEGIQGPTVAAQISPLLDPLRAALPSGYSIVVAGATEESSRAQASIMAFIPLMLVAVLSLLMLQLRSFARALLVYMTGPLGIIGAAFAMLALQAPFGFVAQLGVIALLGMIIRNSVILVDQIEQHVQAGEPVWTAIVEAAVSRARPIMLTAATAVLAMIPLSRSVFWGPMAVAIMGGLIIATVLTLLFLPALYAACFRVKPPPSSSTD
ncbi:MAG: efflux RND transporter permease subunit [Pigmentiphaga sp.]